MKGVKGFQKGHENYLKHHSEETKQKIRKTLTGKILPTSVREKMSATMKLRGHEPKIKFVGKGEENPFYGKHHSEETRKKMSELKKGEKGSNWQGGKSFEFYPQDWTDDLKESIRKRDNYICQECGIHQDELNRKLHVHHIDYDKKNCNPINLITLCIPCHMKTNYNKGYWINYFKNE